MEAYRFDLALAEIWKTIAVVEKRIEESEPWKLSGKKLQATLMELVAHLRQVGYELQPFLPETGEAILEIFKGPKITVPKPLFPRMG
jgi:methionyl-tRNA synthetase